MPNYSEKKSFFTLISAITFIVITTYLISMFASGYRITLKPGSILTATGLLSATSNPKGALVYINDKLTTATDDTVNLSPETYNVKIVKDGYLPWQKDIKIKKETVSQTNTQLYRSIPDFKPLTLTGAINPALSPDGTKIIYAVASASATRNNGLYLIELSDNPITLNRNTPRQIAANFPGIDWAKYTFEFSPNSQSILATGKNNSYLFQINTTLTVNNILNVTSQLSDIKDEWKQQSVQIINDKLTRIPLELQSFIATSSAKSILFSPLEDKLLYLAKTDGVLKENIITPPPAQSTQLQSRNLKKNNYYVYDIKDDTNFLIGPKNKIVNPLWLPDSNKILYIENNNINAIDYDATNKQTLFSGTFNQNVVSPWLDGNRIITLTSPFSTPENLYTITIR